MSENTIEAVNTAPMLIVCAFCTKEDVKKCQRCERSFCTEHAARFSPNFCQECFKNLAVVVDKFVRTSEDYDQTTDKLTTRRESCARIQIDGPDYVFYTKWINNLNDEELLSIFEFHYFIVKLIEHENEVRKINRNKRNREMPLPLATTTVTETRSVKQTKAKDMRTELRKLGLPEATIELMVKAAQGAG